MDMVRVWRGGGRAKVRLRAASLAALTVALAGCGQLPGAESDKAAGASTQARGAAVADLVAVRTLVPGVQQDMRYFGSHNFMGRPVAGYEAPECWLSRPAALALAAVQQQAHAQGLAVKVFDCYRPQRAVDDFVRWGRDLQDQSTRHSYYPRVPKNTLFARGYIAEQSGHSRGSTVDLTLVVVDDQRAAQVLRGPLAEGQEVDMGTPFDRFDVDSHTDNADQPPDVQFNRHWLRTLMEQHGWRNLPEEWWHFTLRDEPYPQQYFDVPVRAAPAVPASR